MLTVILHDWGRRQNQLRLIESLRKQTVQPQIFVWNNNPKSFPKENVDWVIDSSINNHAHAFPYLAQQADTRFVGRFDDDLLVSDPFLLEKVEKKLETINDSDIIIGYCGVKLVDELPYMNSIHINSPRETESINVDIVKGRVMFLDPLGIVPFPKSIHIDIQLSMSIKGYHRVDKVFYNSMKEQPEGDCGYSARHQHTSERNKAVELWKEH